MPIINCYNENEECDNCGVPPVQFILTTDSDDIEKLCLECFSSKYTKPNENEICQ
jgi:hypothetical protein